jgi:hypothetical protein
MRARVDDDPIADAAAHIDLALEDEVALVQHQAVITGPMNSILVQFGLSEARFSGVSPRLIAKADERRRQGERREGQPREAKRAGHRTTSLPWADERARVIARIEAIQCRPLFEAMSSAPRLSTKCRLIHYR